MCGVIIRRRFGKKRWRSYGWERRPSSVREREIGWWRSVWCDNKEEVWEEEVEELGLGEKDLFKGVGDMGWWRSVLCDDKKGV